jgi:hypothetical protein
MQLIPPTLIVPRHLQVRVSSQTLRAKGRVASETLNQRLEIIPADKVYWFTYNLPAGRGTFVLISHQTP